jgi:hypothetical protein
VANGLDLRHSAASTFICRTVMVTLRDSDTIPIYDLIRFSLSFRLSSVRPFSGATMRERLLLH